MDEQFWRNAPKTFCDAANMAETSGLGEIFLLALMSGGNGQVYSFTPEHMKRFSQLVQHNVKTYEDAHGVIRVDDWSPDMKAPFQVNDLRGKK